MVATTTDSQQEPMCGEALRMQIHKPDHKMKRHHGLECRVEFESLAGLAANLMLHRGHEQRERFADLLGSSGQRRDGLEDGLRRLVGNVGYD